MPGQHAGSAAQEQTAQKALGDQLARASIDSNGSRHTGHQAGRLCHISPLQQIHRQSEFCTGKKQAGSASLHHSAPVGAGHVVFVDVVLVLNEGGVRGGAIARGNVHEDCVTLSIGYITVRWLRQHPRELPDPCAVKSFLKKTLIISIPSITT